MELTRRHVLQAVGAAALGFGPEDRVGWAILGLGGYAQGQIMPAFARSKRSQIVALVSGSPDKASRLAGQYGIDAKSVYRYEEIARLRDDPRIQVVYVVTPPGNHRQFVEAAAAAGKHVFCEKPMAPTEADCRTMIEACRKAGKQLGIGYRSRYEPNNVAAILALREGRVGDIRSLTSDHGFSIGTGLWRTEKKLSGGGSMMDIGIYSLNALRYLAGEEPTEVTAEISNPKDDPRFKEVEDTVHFTLRFPSGLVGTGTSGYSWRPGANRYRVLGNRGELRAEPATPYGGHQFTLNGQPLPIDTTAPDQFVGMLDAFSEAVSGGRPFLAPGEEGLRDIRIIQAIYESAEKGRTVKL
jgi:predicted dehydrogenase